MLRSSGGGSHVIQANAPPFGVTLAGLFATPVSCGALATSPQSGTTSEVLPTSSARVRTRTGRIRPVEPPPAAPFFIRLSVSSIRLTRRFAAPGVWTFLRRLGQSGVNLSLRIHVLFPDGKHAQSREAASQSSPGRQPGDPCRSQIQPHRGERFRSWFAPPALCFLARKDPGLTPG